ncbi:MAG: hypothetical protein J6Q22_10470 [Prevotella sp.]|nr:hypothetical protein [Prevotella sp.]
MKVILATLMSLVWMGASCSPIRANIGGMHSSFVPYGGGEDVFYVTNGLIAMWDGEWNAGLGLHDSNAIVWIDLTGNGNNLSEINGTITWGNNFLLSNHGCIYATDVGFAVNDGKSDRTIEIVSYGARNGAQRVHLTIYNGDSGTWGLGHYMWTDIQPKAGYSFSSSNLAIAGFPKVKDLCLSKCIRLLGNVCNMTINADTYAESTRMNYTSRRLFVGNAPNSTFDDEVRVYCVRIYDRVLTDEEVSWNFSIDKKRGFGL